MFTPVYTFWLNLLSTSPCRAQEATCGWGTCYRRYKTSQEPHALACCSGATDACVYLSSIPKGTLWWIHSSKERAEPYHTTATKNCRPNGTLQDPGPDVDPSNDRETQRDRQEWEQRSTDQKQWNSGGGKWRNERYERKQVSWQMSLPRVLQMCFLKFRIDTVSMWRTLFGSCSLGRLDGSSFPRILLSRRLREDDWHKAVGLNKAWKVKFPTWALQTPTVGRWAQEASSVEHLKNPSPRFT